MQPILGRSWPPVGNSEASDVAWNPNICLEAAQVAATVIGLGMHPNSQAQQEFAEMAALREKLHDFTGLPDTDTVQMVWRMGYAETPEPTPRRALEGFLTG